MFASLTSLEALRAAWQDVLANDREDRNLTPGVARFARDDEAQLRRLSDELRAGSFRPGRLTRVSLPREGRAPRELLIPPVRDRVVERALLDVLAPMLDPCLGPCAYAYRAGLSARDAINDVALLRDEGLGWAARADVDDCFPSIDKARVRRLVGALVPDREVVALVDALLDRDSTGPGGPRRVNGVPQGAPLSPLWANLVLVHIDERLLAAGFPTVRYADDFVALARSRDEAWEAMRVANDAVAELDMQLGADKSSVMSFEEGFCFLGEDFGPRYPPAMVDDDTDEPLGRVLYVGLQGARVRSQAGRIVVDSPLEQELLSVPSGQVERIVCFGAVGLSAGARSWALNSSVDTVFLSRRGSYLGHAWPAASGRRVRRLRAQLAAADDAQLCGRFGTAVVEAKVRKQIVLLQRLGRRHNAELVSQTVGQMQRLLMLLPEARARDEIMGVEGAAAREYFGALALLLPPDLSFAGRNRRPPLDVVNAALSYGYAVLLSEAVSALCAAGLDPAIGLLHADDDGRPSLALDLMEEFRPLIVDQVVVAAVNRRELLAHHGRREAGQPGVLLTRAGRELVVDRIERRMLQTTRGALPNFAGSWRRHLYRQAERVATLIAGRADAWTGVSWR